MAANLAGYRDEGYTKFQLKVGAGADSDIERIRLCSQDVTRRYSGGGCHNRLDDARGCARGERDA